MNYVVKYDLTLKIIDLWLGGYFKFPQPPQKLRTTA